MENQKNNKSNLSDDDPNVNQTDNETNLSDDDPNTKQTEGKGSEKMLNKEDHKQNDSYYMKHQANNETRALTPITQRDYKYEDNSCGPIFCCMGGSSSKDDGCCEILFFIAIALLVITLIALIFYGIYKGCNSSFVGQAIGVGLGSAFVGASTAIGTLFGVGAACLAAIPAIGLAALAITGFALAIAGLIFLIRFSIKVHEHRYLENLKKVQRAQKDGLYKEDVEKTLSKDMLRYFSIKSELAKLKSRADKPNKEEHKKNKRNVKGNFYQPLS